MKKQTVTDEVITKYLVFDLLKTISQSQEASKTRKHSFLKSVTLGCTTLVLLQSSIAFLHVSRAENRMYDVIHNHSRFRVLPNDVRF